jgi:hypothetical protein
MATRPNDIDKRVSALEAQIQDVQETVFTRASREALAHAFEAYAQSYGTPGSGVGPVSDLGKLSQLLMAAVEGTGCKTKNCTVEGKVSSITQDGTGAVLEFEIEVTAAGCGLAVGAKFTYTAPKPGLHGDLKMWRKDGTKFLVTFDKNCKIETIKF